MVGVPLAFKYYDQKLSYILADLLIYGFDFKPIKIPIETLIEDTSKPLPHKVEVIIKYVAPTKQSTLLQDFYTRGEIKSHEINEVLKLIHTKLINALEQKSTYLFHSLTRFYRFKSSIQIHFIKDLVSVNSQQSSFIFTITIHITNLKRFTTKLILAVIKEFNIDMSGYCDEVSVIICAYHGRKKAILFEQKLNREKRKDQYKFLTLDNKAQILKFFNNQQVKDILFSYFFPVGFVSGTITEITWDKLKADTRAQKRRRVLHPNGKYDNFHDVITQYTSLKEFVELINRNDICAFYASTRTSRKRHLVTAIIDIDTSGFLRNLLSPQTLWEFTLLISKEIIHTCQSFGLGKPLVVFSGKRGVHLLWRITLDLVKDDYHYTNFWEMYLLPAQKSLRKDPKSPVRSKFGLIKTIFEAILLYTSYNFDIAKIPDEVKVGLGLRSVKDMFKLSPFSENLIGILLDTSSLNASVHRVFSFHFASGLISIPLIDSITKDIAPRYEDYETVLKESKPEFIIDNLNNGKSAQYFQFPTVITKAQIKKLLQPGKGLLPIIAFIIRFSARWVTERSIYSFKFWEEFFSITTFYDYLLNVLIILDPKNFQEKIISNEIQDLIESSKTITKIPVKQLVKEYLEGKLSYISLKNKLDGLRDWEFFYRLKPDAIKSISFDDFQEIFETSEKRRDFLSKFSKAFNIILVWLAIFLEHMKNMNETKKIAVHKLYFRLTLLRSFDKKSKQRKLRNIKNPIGLDLLKTVNLFNIFILFLKDVFKFHRIVYKEGS